MSKGLPGSGRRPPYQGRGRRGVVLALVVGYAVAVPLLATGLVVWGVWLVATASRPWVAAFPLVLAGLVWLGALAAEFGDESPFLLAAVTFLGLPMLLFTAGDTVEAGVIAERGVRTDCVVTRVDLRTETSTSTDANGGTTTRTTTYHDHRLRCAQPSITVLTSNRELASQGKHLAVDYDPEGRLGPLPASAEDSYSSGLRWTILGLLLLVGFRVVVVVGIWWLD